VRCGLEAERLPAGSARASSLLGRRDARNKLGRLGECYGDLIDQDA
jgi:hypothetical protein